jgi:hypothetical protein
MNGYRNATHKLLGNYEVIACLINFLVPPESVMLISAMPIQLGGGG